MLNSIKLKVNKIADIQNCGEEDCYPWKKEECRGCANRRVSVKAVLKVINEAEAKWEADCCEWKQEKILEFSLSDCVTSCGHAEHYSVGIDKYCRHCGKPIKINEVE